MVGSRFSTETPSLRRPHQITPIAREREDAHTTPLHTAGRAFDPTRSDSTALEAGPGPGVTSGVNAFPEPDHEMLELVAECSFCPEGCDDGLTRFAQREQCGLGVTREQMRCGPGEDGEGRL